MADDVTATAAAARQRQVPARAMCADGVQDQASPSWLLCRAGSHLCAVPIAHVVECMRMLPIEALAGAPPYMRGLCIIRGSAVPVVDAAALLFDDQSARCERLVTVRTGTRTIALATESVLGVHAMGGQSLDPLPPLLRDAAAESIAAIAARDAELVFVLRTVRVIPDDLLERIDADGALP